MCSKTRLDRVATFNRNFNEDSENGPEHSLRWTRSIKTTSFYCLAKKRTRMHSVLEGGIVNPSANVFSTERQHMYCYVESDNISDL